MHRPVGEPRRTRSGAAGARPIQASAARSSRATGHATAAAAWFDANDVRRAVVDDDRRPLGLLDAAGAMDGDLLDALVVDVRTRPADVAQRLATHALDPAAPIVVTDDRDRDLGLVTRRRLVRHLATRASRRTA